MELVGAPFEGGEPAVAGGDIGRGRADPAFAFVGAGEVEAGAGDVADEGVDAPGALALAGGGVIGGMYEVGAMTALEERLNGSGRGFDVYVGCSAGSVVAALLASGVRASEIYHVLEEDLDDPLNMRRGVLFADGAFRLACTRFGRFVWAVSKHVLRGSRCLPDVLALAERELPAGFFTLSALERFIRLGLASRPSQGFKAGP